MSAELLAALTARGAEMQVTKLQNIRSFGLAATHSSDDSPISVDCDRMAVMNTELIIRHEKSLMLRNISWYVTSQPLSEPLLGRPIMEALGINTKELLAAACDRFDGLVDVADILNTDTDTDASIARIRCQWFFHSDRAIGDNLDELDEEDSCLEFGIDSDETIQQALEKMMQQAVQVGIEKDRSDRLRGILMEYRDIFRLRLGPDPPAKFEPMRIQIKDNARPIITKARRYTADQREWLEKHVSKLLEYGLVKHNPNASWAAARCWLEKIQLLSTGGLSTTVLSMK